jgi:hypothetical protein
VDSLKHDVAFLLALDILDVFSNLLRDEERRDAFEEVYERARKHLTEYDIRLNRRLQRLHPCDN